MHHYLPAIFLCPLQGARAPHVDDVKVGLLVCMYTCKKQAKQTQVT